MLFRLVYLAVSRCSPGGWWCLPEATRRKTRRSWCCGTRYLDLLERGVGRGADWRDAGVEFEDVEGLAVRGDRHRARGGRRPDRLECLAGGGPDRGQALVAEDVGGLAG